MTKDEARSAVMGAISMALKDPTLQQGFEVICKENAELKSIADFQTSNNMDRYFQLKRKKEQLIKAKECIENLLYYVKQCSCERSNYAELEHDIAEAERFLSEVKG